MRHLLLLLCFPTLLAGAAASSAKLAADTFDEACEPDAETPVPGHKPASDFEPSEIRKAATNINPKTDTFPGKELAAAAPTNCMSKVDWNKYGQESKAAAASQAETSPLKQQRELVDRFMSFEQFMQSALYDDLFGYYSSGKVQFAIGGSAGSHFFTWPTKMIPLFGGMIANQAYAMWISMLESGDITKQETFRIFEFGAGEGILAYYALFNIQVNAEQEKQNKLPTHWAEFYERVHYLIGEISPNLRLRQEERNEIFIKQHRKLEVIPADARDIAQVRKIADPANKGIKGLVVSNELPDAFPVQLVTLNHDGSTKVRLFIPTIHRKTLLQVFQENEKLKMSDTEIRKLEDQSAINRILVAQSGIIIQDAKEKIVLTYKDWLALKRKLAAHDSPAGEIFDAAIDEGMLWLPVDARVFPDILPYLNRHKAYFDRLTNARAELLGVMAINPGAASFIEGVSKLIDKGFVTTIDYGGTSEIHAEHIRGTRGAFRMYPTQPKKMSAFSRPGLFDVTSDVNFTDLALVGEKNGLLPVFYGSQTALRRTPIFFAPQKVATSFEVFNEAFAAIVNLTDINELEKNIHFKMLIQKKGMAAKHVYCLDRPSESLIPQ